MTGYSPRSTPTSMAEPLDLVDYLRDFGRRRAALLALIPENKSKAEVEEWRAGIRRKMTRDDPLGFAITYLSHHLKGDKSVELGDRDGLDISLSEVHEAWIEEAKTWMRASVEPFSSRIAEIAPRESGKSTWWFLINPLWAAAHGHIKFVAAFANTPVQAETHLGTFKAELDNNTSLRFDYPELVVPKTRGRGAVEADRVSMYHAKSGFVFAAAGMDSSNLGLKVGSQRPDVIILDDIEPHEANYSSNLAGKRLATLQDAILPLNIRAHVVMVGTVTMTGSIMHQLVQAAQGRPAEWVVEQRILAHHYPAIVSDGVTGVRRSIWPGKWSLAFLTSIEHTRNYAKNYANDPIGADGDYWTMDDFRYGPLEAVTRIGIFLDPAVTTKDSSDYTGYAVIAYSPSTRAVKILAAGQVKLDGTKLRLLALRLIEEWHAGVVVIEANQGGALWLKILWGLGVPVRTFTNSVKKEVRAASVLDRYQRGRVLHADNLKGGDAEGQLVGFPKAANDDIVDAIGSGVAYYLTPAKRKRASAGVASYAG
jgi:phage terminase large subunit-like protein